MVWRLALVPKDEDLIQTFFNYLEFERRYSPHTIDAYKSDIGQYLDFLTTAYDLSDITQTKALHLRSWLVDLHEHKISNRSINRKISALKSLFNFFRKRHGLKSNPLSKIINPKTEKRLPLTVRKEHLSMLLQLDPKPEDQNQAFSTSRNRLILDILYSCGLRRSELIQIRLKDIDFSRRLLRVEGKGKKERWLPLSPELCKNLNLYLVDRLKKLGDLNPADQDSLFITDQGDTLYPKWVYNLVRKSLGTVTSIEKKSPHILRHSFATHLSDAGADLNAIKTLLGHSSLAATQVYMHNSVEKLKKIYDQAHPKS